MSLLLDALKKAAEAKARQESAPSAETAIVLEPAVEPQEEVPPRVERAPEPFEDHFKTTETHEPVRDDAAAPRISPYDEFDDTQQLVGDFGDKSTATYGSSKHAKTVFSSKRVQKPLRGGLPVIKSLGILMFVGGIASASYYYIQDRDYELLRQVTRIRKQAPIVPLQLYEESARQEVVAPVPGVEGEVADQSIAASTGVAEPVTDQRLFEELAIPAVARERAVANRDSSRIHELAAVDTDKDTDTEPTRADAVASSDIEMAEPEVQDANALDTGLLLVASMEPVPVETEIAEAAPDKGETAEKSARSRQQIPTDAIGGEDSGNLSITHSSRQLEADVHVREAYAAYQAGSLDEAAVLYDRALQIDQRHRDALLGRAAIYLHRGQDRPAIEIYQRLLSLNPRDHAALAGLNSMARQDNLTRYESDLRFLLRDTPDSAPLNYALGSLLSRQKRWSGAQRHFFAALAGDPQSPDIAYNLAVSLDNLGKSAPAANFYRSALDLARTRASSFDKVRVYRRLQVLE